MTISKACRVVVAAAVLVMAAGVRPSFAGAIISHGGVTLGIWETANLDLVNGSNPAVGIALAGVGDGINADALWEGWGVGVVLNGSGKHVAGGASGRRGGGVGLGWRHGLGTWTSVVSVCSSQTPAGEPSD